MKQKNLILMVVAVGCGLAAAFLTSRMSGGAKPDAVPQKDVLVAVKDLNAPTKFTKEAVKDLVKHKLVNVADVPDDAVESEEELVEQSLVQPVSANVILQKAHMNKNGEVPIPPGKTGLISIKLPLEQVTPFIKPTSRVNLMGVVTNKFTNKVSADMLIPNMHVTAVDTQYVPTPGAAQGIMQLQVVTLAVSTDEAKLIRMCQSAGVNMGFVLIGHASDQANTTEEWDLERRMAWVNDAQNGSGSAPSGPTVTPMNTTPAPAVQYVKVPVAVEDLPPGTELTSDVIEKKFKMIDYLEAPANAVTDLKGHIGHFLHKEVGANQFLPTAVVSNKAPMKRAASGDEATVKSGTEPPEVAKAPKKPTADRSITGPSGTRTYRYEQQEDKNWKLIGEVHPDGSVTPTGGGVAPTDDKKDDKPAPPKQLG